MSVMGEEMNIDPILISFLLNLGYLAFGALLLRLLIVYLNRSSVSGESFTFHDAMEKIHGTPIALAIVMAGALVGFGILLAAFIRG